MHAFMTSRLDYCNALMYRLPACIISKLQRLQSSAARIVIRSRKFDHITPILRDLHWLPVSKRISFKVLILTYRALHDLAPDYIADLVMPYSPAPSCGLHIIAYWLCLPPDFNPWGTGVSPAQCHHCGKVSHWQFAMPRHRLIKFKSLLKTHFFIDAFRNELL